jgi:hypothetical protein
MLVKKRSPLIEEDEVFESDEWAARILGASAVRTDADPGDAAVDAILSRFWPDTAHADHGAERPAANAPHATVDAEAPRRIGISSVRTLVDQSSDHEDLRWQHR